MCTINVLVPGADRIHVWSGLALRSNIREVGQHALAIGRRGLFG